MNSARKLPAVLAAALVAGALAACHLPPQGARPTMRYFEVSGDTLAPAVDTRRLELPGARWLALREYPNPNGRASVLLVHGLGTNSRVWDLPGYGGLARDLWQAGFAVYAVDLMGAGESWQPGPFTPGKAEQTLKSWTNELGAVVDMVALAAPGRPLLGVGLDVGGTALHHLAASGQSALDGHVAIGAPLSFGGSTKALKLLFELPGRLAADEVSWRDADDNRLPPWWHANRNLARQLLGEKLPADVWEAFLTEASSPMPGALLRSIAKQAGEPVARADQLVLSLATRSSYPIFAVIASADTLAPPWQCDPSVFGLRRENITRKYFTRADGAWAEYGHLELVLHPRARTRVFPSIIRWLKDQSP